MLRDVARERRVIRKALEKAQMADQCIVIEAEIDSAEDMFRVFRHYPSRISVFHYAGHGDEDALLLYLEAEKAKGLNQSALTSLLDDSSIKLVFLNCCSSKSHADALLAAGVPAVIASSCCVQDDLACDFAESFYEGIASGHTIKRAFELSRNELSSKSNISDAPMRSPRIGTRNLGNQALLWELHANKRSAGAKGILEQLSKESVPAPPKGAKWWGMLSLVVIGLVFSFAWRPASTLISELGLVNARTQTSDSQTAVTQVADVQTLNLKPSDLETSDFQTPQPPTADMQAAATQELCQNSDDVIPVPDAQLESALLETLGVDSLNCATVSELIELEAEDKGIRSLAGLEHFTSLSKLKLDGNAITDLTPLANLENLKSLRLKSNQIESLEPLRTLTKLKTLSVSDNVSGLDLAPLAKLENLDTLNISNLKPVNVTELASLSKLLQLDVSRNAFTAFDIETFVGNELKELWLGDNQIDDIGVLTSFPSLVRLGLGNNYIADISALQELENLETLQVSGNMFTDIAPLVNNAGLGEGDVLKLAESALDLSPGSQASTDIETLRARGVGVLLEAAP